MTWRKVKLTAGCLALLTGEIMGAVRASKAQEQAGLANATQSGSETENGQTQNSTSETTTQDSQDPLVNTPNTLGPAFLKNLVADQESIWTSPARLRWADGSWLLPLATVSGVLFASDKSLATSLSHDPLGVGRYNNVSNYGVGALVAGGAGFYLWGRITHDEHKRESGMLAGEAAIDGYAANEVLAYALGRERPYQDQGNGTFFRGGTSFPSDHSTVAWALASVFAHEYPGPLTEVFAYGLATGVSLSRVAGEEHFPSDVLIGSAIGWFIGREVFRAHHDTELGGSAVGDFAPFKHDEGSRDRRHMGTAFVEMDSWVYPALERLVALGYIRTAIMGEKPWTRMECARLIEEASEALAQDNSGGRTGAYELETQLQKEFSYETDLLEGGRNFRANVDSVYARAVSINGPDLSNSFHFGQTVGYDFGRPFERGTNGQAGGSVSADAGPLTFYLRAEYQHAPSAPALTGAQRDLISLTDFLPLSDVPAGPVAGINRPELLDAYAAVNLGNWQLSVGRQTLSWGPSPDPMLWSDNITPLGMIRLVDPEPFHLPAFLKYLGALRLDQFVGILDGHPFVPRPFVYGQKFNFKPLPFLELGIGRATMIGGVGGDPLTLGNFARSLVGYNHSGFNHGKSETDMDWTFSVPGVHNYVVLYGDAYAVDNVVAALEPQRNPWHPGIYITRFPKIPKLDFHMEGVSTEAPGIGVDLYNKGQFNYFDDTYRDGFTNDSFLMGNTVGRDGRSIQSWWTYWLSANNNLKFIYRHNSVATDFIPGGGAWQDYAVSSETYLGNGIYVKAQLQFENIAHYPILFDGPEKNFTAIFEFGFSPQTKLGAKKNDP